MSLNSSPLCRFCRTPLRATLVDLGSTPLANSYLSPEELGAPEPTFPLHARLCSACRLVQVDDVAAPERSLGITPISRPIRRHGGARALLRSWQDHGGLNASLVIEVASNDGYC
jgi:hypothetical protein